MKAAQVALAERDLYRTQAEGLQEQVDAKDRQLAALRGLLQIQEQISKDWMEAALGRKQALQVDDKLIANYDQQIIKLTERAERAERSRWTYSIISFVIGVGVGNYARR